MKAGMLPIKTIETHATLTHLRMLISDTSKTLLVAAPHSQAYFEARQELKALFTAEAQAVKELAQAIESEREA